eukprot:CFRG6712T1
MPPTKTPAKQTKRVFKLEKSSGHLISWPRVSRNLTEKFLHEVREYTDARKQQQITALACRAVPLASRQQNSNTVDISSVGLNNNMQALQAHKAHRNKTKRFRRNRCNTRKGGCVKRSSVVETYVSDNNTLPQDESGFEVNSTVKCETMSGSTKTSTDANLTNNSVRDSVFVVGVRDVTKKLAKNELEVLLIGEDVKSVMVQHLPILSERHRVRSGVLSASSADIAEALGMRCVTAVGVMKMNCSLITRGTKRARKSDKMSDGEICANDGLHGRNATCEDNKRLLQTQDDVGIYNVCAAIGEELPSPLLSQM